MLDEFQWSPAMAETIFFCSIPGVKEKIIQGISTPLEECVEDLGDK